MRLDVFDAYLPSMGEMAVMLMSFVYGKRKNPHFLANQKARDVLRARYEKCMFARNPFPWK